MLKPFILSSILLLVGLATSSSTAGQVFFVNNKTGCDSCNGLAPAPTYH